VPVRGLGVLMLPTTLTMAINWDRGRRVLVLPNVSNYVAH
jgi:hypothetical protein